MTTTVAKRRRRSQQSIDRRIIKQKLQEWTRSGIITMAEAVRIMWSEADVKGTAHAMLCTTSTNVRRYWVGWVEVKAQDAREAAHEAEAQSY